MLWLLCVLVNKAAITKCYRLLSLNNRNLLHSSGGYKSCSCWQSWFEASLFGLHMAVASLCLQIAFSSVPGYNLISS